MSASVEDFLVRWKGSMQKIRMAAPEIGRAFGGLHVAAMKPGSLAVREKELIAMAVGLTQGCTDCIFLHTEGALKAGATREQVVEAAGVAVLMAGGPAFVHLPAVLEALDHLAPGQGAKP
jgi:AhpD family alkylhydroperoxidase